MEMGNEYKLNIVGYLTHGTRGGKILHHQQDQVLGKNGIMKALTAGSHNNAEWMQFVIEIYELNDKEY